MQQGRPGHREIYLSSQLMAPRTILDVDSLGNIPVSTHSTKDNPAEGVVKVRLVA